MMNIRQKGRFAPNLFDGSNWFWIGANDLLLEGRFVWEDGTPLNYTNWGKGQPDNAHPLRGGKVLPYNSNFTIDLRFCLLYLMYKL